jgi:hypothetical protein
VFEVGISDFPRSCVGSDAGIPAGRHGWLGVSIEKPKPDAVGPGTYVVAGDFSGTTTTVSASFFPYEASCDGFPVPGMTGQIRLAHVDETSAEGVVDLTLDDGTRLEGAFAATRCPPPPGIGPLPDGGDPTFPEPEICPWATQR